MASDCYQILGVIPTASADEIRAAYRRLARLYHPDLNSGPEAEARMQQINQAYDTLSNPARRRQYDASALLTRRPAHASPRARRANASRSARIVLDPRPDAPIPQRGADIEAAVSISPREARRGVRKSFPVQRLETCPRCRGSGIEPEETFQRSGCWRCSGAQRLHRELQLHATIPPGVTDGQRLRLRGQGNAGTDGGTHGHIYITTRLHPPHRIGRMAAFLWRHLIA